MSPKGGKKALKAAKTLRTSPVVEPLHLPTRSPLDDGARSQMFYLSDPLQTNLSAPLRRRSGGPPLNPGLPEHTPRKRRGKEQAEPALSIEGQQFDPNLGSRLEQAVDDRLRQVMSEQAPLKEWIEERSAKGAANEESAKGASGNESNEGSVNKDNEHNAAPALEKAITNEKVKDSSKESSNASIADKNAKAMAEAMWKEHPSSQASFALSSAEQQRHDAYTLLWKDHHDKQRQKSATTAFFEENAKGSSPKWGDLEDEEIQSAPLWNYNATTEDNASSSAATPAEKSNNGTPSGKEEIEPNPAKSTTQNEADTPDATPKSSEKFKAFLKDKLQERQHALLPSASNPPSREKPPASPRENVEDEVMQVDSQGNSLTIPQHLAELIDGSQEEEVGLESLLLPELHARYLRGELNSIDDVRITFEAVMGADFSGMDVVFVYDVCLRLMQSSDPIGVMAKNYAIKQDKMIEEQRLLCFEDMARLHRQVKERSVADTAQLAKDMQAVNAERENELLKLKNEHRTLVVSNALLNSDYEMLKLKQSAITGIEGYAQCRQELQDALKKLELKTSECKVYQEQMLKLGDALRLQSVAAPVHEAPAPAPAEENLDPPPGWDHSSRSRAIEETAMAWGVHRAPEIFNNGWGDSPGESSFSETSHNTQTGGPTQFFGWSNKNYREPARGLRGQDSGIPFYPNPKGGKGKRGRDHADDARNVRQKSWTKDGKSIAEDWSRSHSVHTQFRLLPLSAVQTLLETLKSADASFQQIVRNVNSERWQEHVNTNFLVLHQDLGIPNRPTVSPHFYYQAAQWQCHNRIDMLSNNELSDAAYKDDLRANTNTFEIGTTTIAVPLNVVQLGDKETPTGNVILNDFKIAKHYLSQQEQLTRSYVSRRDNFYKIVAVNGDDRKTRTFLDKATHIQMHRDFHRFPKQESTRFFKQLFDEAFKSHYNKIMNEILAFATHNIPLDYTQRFATDIRVLYFYNANCTSVRPAL